MLANYLNNNAKLFLESFSAEEDRAWVWTVIECLKKRFPKADHWTTGGPQFKYTDLRVGRKRNGSKDGLSVFFLVTVFSKRPTCTLAKWLVKGVSPRPRMSIATHPSVHDIEQWLDQQAQYIEPNRKNIDEGEAQNPIDFGDNSIVESDETEDLDGTAEQRPALLATKQPLNQILFGPPGTGKTYATIDETLNILDPQFMAANPDVVGASHAERKARRAILKARFDQFAADRRVRFVTFHQSFSYEDFVEGLKATMTDQGSLKYEVAPGVFQEICGRAQAAWSASQPGQAIAKPIDLAGRRIWKMSLGAAEGADAYVYDDCMDQDIALLGYGDELDFNGCEDEKQVEEKFIAEGEDPKQQAFAIRMVNTFKNKVKRGDLLIISDGNLKFRAIGEVVSDYFRLKDEERSQDHYKQARKIQWLRKFDPSLSAGEVLHKNFSMQTLYELHPHALDQQKLKHLLAPAGTVESAGEEPYVLIIDEINRGSVSRIFGELITLIEDSKRAGAEEALSVTLPYSKLPFAVPQNLHLLGTMNTADRSLAGLDIALRRRFVFKEMPPQPALLKNVLIEGDLSVGDLLAKMNERIEVLLDRDHLLGHASFMRLAEDGGNTLGALASIFRNQVLPLLQEYFFEDWERISWVLNDSGKANVSHRFIKPANHSLDSLFGSEIAARLGGAKNRRWQLNSAAFDNIESYRGILKSASAPKADSVPATASDMPASS